MNSWPNGPSAEVCRGFLLFLILEDCPGDFPGRFFCAIFPHKHLLPAKLQKLVSEFNFDFLQGNLAGTSCGKFDGNFAGFFESTIRGSTSSRTISKIFCKKFRNSIKALEPTSLCRRATHRRKGERMRLFGLQLEASLTDCKQGSSTVSRKAPTVNKIASPEKNLTQDILR